jgi:hypothetical protein
MTVANAVYLKARSNIVIPTDIVLAERECRPFFDKVIAVDSHQVSQYLPLSQERVTSNARANAPIGFVGIDCRDTLLELAPSLSFIQEIWFEKDNKLALSLPNSAAWLRVINTLQGTFIFALPLMAASEFLTALDTEEVSEKDLVKVTDYLTSGIVEEKSDIGKAMLKKITSTPHVHGLHRYKAKFFPRMIRSFITSNRSKLPSLESGKIVLVDPFVGSGTALVESTLLGIESIGIDIDLLSCVISRAKLELMQIDLEKLKSAIEKTILRFNSLQEISVEPKYSFPLWISDKFARLRDIREQEKYEKEITRWRKAISEVNQDEVRQILQVCLSDAITRKFNIRMLGTGVGRFALEIRDAELSTIMTQNLHSLVHIASVVLTLKQVYSLKLPQSKVFHDTATHMPLADKSASIVLTSPPYLPASSGRENYLIGKSISITALELMTPDQIRETEVRSVGSMKTNSSVDLEGLPEEVNQLHHWLNTNELRKIKAKPCVAYYNELKSALFETYRILASGGLAIFVIGKESVFYNYKSRKILYRVACDKIFQELARNCGFIIDERVDVELDKRNSNARPRSLDAFFETVFVLKKP